MSARLPVWARRVAYVGGGMLFAAGAFLSGWSLTLLAEQCGIPRPFSVMLPLALDSGAAVGVALWIAGQGRLSAAGKRTARLLFGLSVAGNAVERLSAYRDLPTSFIPRPALAGVAIGVAVVFPLLAYLMAHLVLLVRQSEAEHADANTEWVSAQVLVARAEEARWDAERVRRDADHELALAEAASRDADAMREAERRAMVAHRASQQATATGSHTPSRRSSRKRSQPASRAERREWVRQERAAGRVPSGADVDRQFGAPRNGAAVVREVDAEQPQRPRLAVAGGE